MLMRAVLRHRTKGKPDEITSVLCLERQDIIEDAQKKGVYDWNTEYFATSQRLLNLRRAKAGVNAYTSPDVEVEVLSLHSTLPSLLHQEESYS